MKDKEIVSKGPKKRDAACQQMVHPLIIGAGTILRQEPGKPGVFSCQVGYGTFTVTAESARDHPGTYKQVIA